jgi:hypothetical protein
VAEAYHPLVNASIFLLVMWLAALWLYRRRVFIKV